MPEGDVSPEGESGRQQALVDQNKYSERHWKRQTRDSFAWKDKIYAIEDGQWKRVGTKRWYTPRKYSNTPRRVKRHRRGIRNALWDHAQEVMKGDI